MTVSSNLTLPSTSGVYASIENAFAFGSCWHQTPEQKMEAYDCTLYKKPDVLQISQDSKSKNWVLLQNQTLATIAYNDSLVITEPASNSNAVWLFESTPLWKIVQTGAYSSDNLNVPVRIMPDNNENQCVVINNTSSTPPNGTPLILSNCADQSAEWIINIHMNLNV